MNVASFSLPQPKQKQKWKLGIARMFNSNWGVLGFQWELTTLVVKQGICDLLIKKTWHSWILMTQTCSSTYVGGWDWEDHCLRTALAKKKVCRTPSPWKEAGGGGPHLSSLFPGRCRQKLRLCLQNNHSKKGWRHSSSGRAEDPEFKPQYWQKKKKKKKQVKNPWHISSVTAFQHLELCLSLTMWIRVCRINWKLYVLTLTCILHSPKCFSAT
jgi:hypothetical protein